MLDEPSGSGAVSSERLARPTILRSWLADASLRDRVYDLVREAMHKAVVVGATKASDTACGPMPASCLHTSALTPLPQLKRRGRPRRTGESITCTADHRTRKPGNFILARLESSSRRRQSCDSAAEQRRILITLTDEIEAQDVSYAYIAQTLGIALSGGPSMGGAEKGSDDRSSESLGVPKEQTSPSTHLESCPPAHALSFSYSSECIDRKIFV